MRIDPKGSVAGTPILKIRDFLRRNKTFGWYLSVVQRTFHVSRGRAAEIMTELESQGLVECEVSPTGEKVWKTTPEGNRFGNALAGHPVKRSTAQRHLNAFLDRVHTVKDSPDFLFKVKRVLLFGSFLDESRNSIGDIDLAIELGAKEKDPDQHFRLLEEYGRNQLAKGRTPGPLGHLDIAELDTRRFLKARSRVIQITSTSDSVLNLVDAREVYVDDS